MRKNRNILIFGIPVLSICFVSFISAAGQTPPGDYRFLEVVDTDGKPVAGAIVEALGYDRGVTSTDLKGQSGLRTGMRDFRRVEFRVSKPGYFSYEDIGDLGDHLIGHSHKTLKLELLSTDGTAAERRTAEDQQRKRDFFVAVKKGDFTTVRKLLQAGLGANLTTTDLRGIPVTKDIPVIIWAAASGDGETVKALLAAGADARSKNKPGHTALLYYLKAASYLLPGTGTDDEKASLIRSYEDGLRMLIRAGADINAVGKGMAGQTPLILAAVRGTPGTVKMLLNAGASVNATNNGGATALMAVAIHDPRAEIVNILLKAGADPNAVQYYGYESSLCETALTQAVEMNSINIMQALIANKADVNLACPNGKTALISAVGKGNINAVKLLIKAGANLKGKQGQTALMYAKQCQSINPGCPEILKLLEAAGAARE